MFSYFSYKIGFDNSCKLSPKETICMKCQILFYRKNKKNINFLFAESAHSLVSVKLFMVVSVNLFFVYMCPNI